MGKCPICGEEDCICGCTARCAMDETRKEEAVRKLAQLFWEESERLDPGLGATRWTELSEFDRRHYELCIEAVLRDRGSVLAALGLSDDDVVDRSTQKGK